MQKRATLSDSPFSSIHGLKPVLQVCPSFGSHMGVESVVFSFAEALTDGTGSRDAALEIATWMCDTYLPITWTDIA